MALENRLKEYRARLGINQADMGKLAGVSRQTISLREWGYSSFSVTWPVKLAERARGRRAGCLTRLKVGDG